MNAPYATAEAPEAEPLPPHALDSEQALLGAILHNNEALDLARQHVEPSDFFEDVHRHIFEVMCARRDAGEPIDRTMMRAVLGDADLGGVTVGAYLARLYAEATTVVGAPGYARLIEPPPSEALPGIAEAVHPAELLVFSKRLVQAAHKRNRNPRWEKVNRSRLVLARLCLDRALGLEMRHAEAEAAETGKAISEPDASDLVAETFHTFGEDAAQSLADRLSVAFEDCGEAIKRLERRSH